MSSVAQATRAAAGRIISPSEGADAAGERMRAAFSEARLPVTLMPTWLRHASKEGAGALSECSGSQIRHHVAGFMEAAGISEASPTLQARRPILASRMGF